MVNSIKSNFVWIVIIALFILGCSTEEAIEEPKKQESISYSEEDSNENALSIITLNLRVHIMKDITMVHPTGFPLENWVTTDDVEKTIVPELNDIWEQAGIVWSIESILEENVVKGENYQESLNYIVNAKRDSNGNSDPERLPHLYSLMQPQHRSAEENLRNNLFHIYLFPFIGNTSQGNAMKSFNNHSVVGTWTNKHNGGGIPEKTLLTESHSSFTRGSLARTIAHEIGHVLTLSHNECANECLMGGTNSDGYQITDSQIIASRIEAIGRSF